MKAELLFRLNVPCRTPQGDSAFFVGNKTAYLSSKSLVRLELNGAIIVSPGLNPYSFYFDSEVVQSLVNGQLLLEGLDTRIVDLLYDKQVIVDEPSNQVSILHQANCDYLPVYTLLEVTSVCNCCCKTCYHGRTLGGITPPLAEIYERICKLSLLGSMIFEVTGGEPTMRTDLADILAFIREMGLGAYIVTNGEFIDQVSPDLINELRLSRGVAISLDGVNETHDLLRGRPGLFRKLLSGASRLREEDVKFHFVSTINERNYQEISEMIQVAASFGTILQLRPTIRTGRAIEEDIGYLNYKALLSGFPSSSYVRNSLVSLKQSDEPAVFYGCRSRSRIAVDVRGQIFPCVMDRTRSLGNVFDFTPSELNAAIVKDLTQLLEKSPACQNCPVNRDRLVCSGFCHLSNKYHRTNSA